MICSGSRTGKKSPEYGYSVYTWIQLGDAYLNPPKAEARGSNPLGTAKFHLFSCILHVIGFRS